MADKTCFFIAPIGERDSLVRKRSDQVLRYLVRAVLEPMGYAAQRADELDDEGLITNQVVERLVEGDLVVADLTGRNPNVFYELAVRHAARKPVVHLIADGEDIPFDVANMRAVSYALSDPDLLSQAQTELRRKVEAIETATEHAPNPITAALDLQALRASDEPDKEVMGTMLTAIADLRLEVHSLGRQLRHELPARSPEGGRGFPSVGAIVHHAQFGTGYVAKTESNGVVVVRFEGGPERQLVWEMAPIRVSEEPETSPTAVRPPPRVPDDDIPF